MRLTSVLVVLAAGLTTCLLAVPGTAADEKLAPPTRAQLVASENNLKQIGLGFHNHEAAFRVFPNNIYSKDGKGLLSWRVHILPFVGRAQVLMADGSVKRLRKDPDEKELRKLIGYNDGEIIDFTKLEAK